MCKNGHNSASIFKPNFETPKYCFLFDTHFGGAYAKIYKIYACFERKNSFSAQISEFMVYKGWAKCFDKEPPPPKKAHP